MFFKDSGQLQSRVAELERKVGFLLKELGLESKSEVSLPHIPEVEDALRRGRKIEAVRIYREKTGTDLKGSADAIEKISARMGLK